MTLTTGSRVLVIVTAQISASGGSVSFSLNGAAASPADAVSWQPARGDDHGGRFDDGELLQASTTTYLSVAPGTNTFSLAYEALGHGVAAFANRTITVVPLN